MAFPSSLLLLSANRDEYALALESFAARNLSVRCVEGAFRLAADFAAAPTDVAILDIEHVGQPVVELIEVLREKKPDLGVVVVATAAQRDIAGLALCKGADILLCKPASCAEVMAAVERAYRRTLLAKAAPAAPAEANGDALTRFAMGVAHEVNNPLTTISGWLQMLLADHAEDKQLSEMLKSVSEEADRIADVVRQLLTVAHQNPPGAEPVQMDKFVKELARYHTPLLKADNITLTTDIAKGLPAVKGDAAQLRQACDTVLTEIRSAMNGSGRIDFTCRTEDNGVALEFRDNGPPIPKDALERLFDPFEFGRNANGTGLGLCLARSIVRGHGGTLDVESGDAGTRYAFWLPSPST